MRTHLNRKRGRSAVHKFNAKRQAFESYKALDQQAKVLEAELSHMRKIGEYPSAEQLDRLKNLRTLAAFMFERYLNVRYVKVS